MLVRYYEGLRRSFSFSLLPTIFERNFQDEWRLFCCLLISRIPPRTCTSGFLLYFSCVIKAHWAGRHIIGGGFLLPHGQIAFCYNLGKINFRSCTFSTGNQTKIMFPINNYFIRAFVEKKIYFWIDCRKVRSQLIYNSTNNSLSLMLLVIKLYNLLSSRCPY